MLVTCIFSFPTMVFFPVPKHTLTFDLHDCIFVIINTLPDNKILALSKLKAFADNNFSVT